VCGFRSNTNKGGERENKNCKGWEIDATTRKKKGRKTTHEGVLWDGGRAVGTRLSEKKVVAKKRGGGSRDVLIRGGSKLGANCLLNLSKKLPARTFSNWGKNCMN